MDYYCHHMVLRSVKLRETHADGTPRSAAETSVKRPERCNTRLLPVGDFWYCYRSDGGCGAMWTQYAVDWAQECDKTEGGNA